MAENDKPIPPPSFQISRQMDQEKIDVLTKRIEELIAINNNLRTSAEKNEKDKQDIYLYYQREMEMKEDVIIRLNEELIKKENQIKAELEKVKRRHEQELFELRKESSAENETLRNRCQSLENEVSLLDAFKHHKEHHDRKLEELEIAVNKHNIQLNDALEAQERKFLDSKSRLLKDLEDQKESFRELAARDARMMMDAETRKIMSDNRRMMEELKFHNAVTEELQQEKVRLEHSLALSRREVALLSQKEEEYSKQGALRAREINSLKESVEQLERNQLLTVEKFRGKARELQGAVQKELEEATLDATGLRRLIKIKNKELRQMKKLAATILEQRGEVEQFFLESLAEVKDMVQKEGRRSGPDALRELNRMRANAIKSGGTFPSIRASGMDHIHPRTKSTLPERETDKVFIKDLNWEDKETVLRLLFAKMNGLQQSVNGVGGTGGGGGTQTRESERGDRAFLTQRGGTGTGTGTGSRRSSSRGETRGSSAGDDRAMSPGEENYLARLDRAFPTEPGDEEEGEDGDDMPGIMSLAGLA
mmetsp:Transcript_12527/g.12611  ORF Transcript_12527/g.12611 Transcript_12527/m.12611 type:complete len:537 (+) Transcript_12527:235-1845(+)|eukprot:CAMPEP_0182426250 /NCGR_PEP_ID=MMETSP1167-20130531/12741_1 /TAXON_ID=2988 /ORGANISM="Mallomonas Sp, Strain CCMP3275" /LENGTH=536 /DNA_ID=CAMNT_0024607557 /DNA_START=162 /DNA_END=1772 /DNA_ORIENTATION=+